MPTNNNSYRIASYNIGVRMLNKDPAFMETVRKQNAKPIYEAPDSIAFPKAENNNIQEIAKHLSTQYEEIFTVQPMTPDQTYQKNNTVSYQNGQTTPKEIDFHAETEQKIKEYYQQQEEKRAKRQLPLNGQFDTNENTQSKTENGKQVKDEDELY